MEKIGNMLIWPMNSWDLKKDTDGSIYMPIHRHDSSILKIPMALNMQPVGSPDMKFICNDGDYKGFCGYQTGWIPQAIS
jgi:hypothetical protein